MQAKEDKMIELKNISFQRDNKKILNDINLKIGSNEFIAITGPNGSRQVNTSQDNYGNRKARYR